MRRRAGAEQPKIAADRLALLALIEAEEGEGRAVPCRTGDAYVTAAWTADGDDEQRVAAAACSPCPVKRECRRFGLAWPDLPGVYGGRTERERQRAVKQPHLEEGSA